MKTLNEETVGGIAALRPEALSVFERHGIDYCCGGGERFEEACRRSGVEPGALLEEIDRESGERAVIRFQPATKTLTELIGHIVGHHHRFTRDELDRLRPLGAKVVEAHSANHPELLEVVAVLDRLAAELAPHMLKEETVLFPYIQKLERIGADSEKLPDSPFGTVRNPIRMMMQEHDLAGDLLAEIHALTNAHTIPDDACPSYQSLYRGLQGLEADLHEHIHVENNVLFPKAEIAEDRAKRC